MTIFSPLSTGITSLEAQSTVLQTIGNNIANATTPGYSRQEVELEGALPTNFVRFQVGKGVNVMGIRRVIDTTLETRLQDSGSSLNFLSIKNRAFQQIEILLNVNSGADIGAMLNKFFTSISDLANNPASTATRSVVIQQAKTLSTTFNSLITNAKEQRKSLNEEVKIVVAEINRIAGEISSLNTQIVKMEGGGNNFGAANNLRDQRGLLIKQLAELTDLRSIEDTAGNVNILVGSSYLVFEGNSFDITTTQSADDGVIIDTPKFVGSGNNFVPTSGKLAALLEGRDTDLKSFIQDINVLANSIIYNFNKVHSTGQGINRFSDITSEHSVTNAAATLAIPGQATSTSLTKNSIRDLSLAGAPNLTGRSVFILSGNNILERRTVSSFDSVTGTMFFNSDFTTEIQSGDRYQIGDMSFAVQNGSFDLVITNEATGVQTTANIAVDLDKLPTIDVDATLNNIETAIDAAGGGTVTASIVNGRLRIQSSSSTVTFSFANDTSGFLAAIGLGNFFTGKNAETMGVNSAIEANPLLLAAATSNVAGNNSNALLMAQLRSQQLVKGSFTFEDFYRSIVGEVGVDTSQSKDQLDAQQNIQLQLENQRERVSGVNIDEEATRMLLHQRAFQASARLIVTIDQMLETLMNI